MIKKVLLATLVAAAVGGTAVPTIASADVIVRVAPPAPRYEVVPAARRGWVWVPGYWDWRRGRHVWVSGTWVRERPGYRYYGPQWAERDGRWHMAQGYWRRGDRDGDGVPNRYDRAPDNPRRY